MTKLKRIIWAIDPYAEGVPQKKVTQVLNSFAKKARFQVECVYVVKDLTKSVLMEASPDWLEHAIGVARTRIGKTLKAVKASGAKKVTLLTAKGKENVVSVFLRYARKMRPDLVVVTTHAKRGFERLLMGSFAETMILNTKTPLLVVNPSAAGGVSAIREVVFATDFSASSRKAFRSLLDLAKVLGAKVTLFHQLSDIPLFAPESNTLFLEPGLLQSQIDMRKRDGLLWAKLAAGRGVDCKAVIDESIAGSLDDAILRYVEKNKPQVLALQSKSGAVQSLILGSTARNLVRRSRCPVLVFR